jgi:hypothetical protein
MLEASHVSLGDIPRRRSHSITELFNELKPPLKAWSIEEVVYLYLQLS